MNKFEKIYNSLQHLMIEDFSLFDQISGVVEEIDFENMFAAKNGQGTKKSVNKLAKEVIKFYYQDLINNNNNGHY
jgi:hypothetical protein